MTQLNVLYEDNHLLVVDKPAGIATMGTQASQSSMVRQAAAYLKQKYSKPGNVYVGVVSRLDRLVSGVLVLARTSKAAGRLAEQLRNRTVTKRYMAGISGQLQPEDGSWQEVVHWVYKDERRQRMRAAAVASDSTKEARLRFRTIACAADVCLLEVDLMTGRKHQIRLQLSELGHPILGDVKYGSQQKFSHGIALHCQRMTIVHPTTKQPMEFRSSPRAHWRKHVPGRLLAAISSD